jgi:DsbC/DsbD-like thiol-disulfide interchange protein
VLASASAIRAETPAFSASGQHSRVRLIAAGPATPGGAPLAGVEIALDPGFKTYWRHPGESGLPPAFDWSRSTNVAAAEVLWPAPRRFEDAGGVSYGYRDRVVFPVRIVPQDPDQPVRLVLALEYGVCKDLCIPARASVGLDLATASVRDAALVQQALTRVPAERPLGADETPAILTVQPVEGAGKPMLRVPVRVPVESKPQLFVEVPEGWYVAAHETLEGARAPAGQGVETGTFVLDILERPKQASGPLWLRLTLVAGERAVESVASLDSGQVPR